MDEEEAKEWGRERRARRREWTDVKDEEFDHRHTRNAKFKRQPFVVRFRPDVMAKMEARRAKLNFGGGMSRSAYLEMLVLRDTTYGRAAREAREEWATGREDEPLPPPPGD